MCVILLLGHPIILTKGLIRPPADADADASLGATNRTKEKQNLALAGLTELGARSLR